MSDVGYTEFQPHAINSQEITTRGYGMAPAGVKDDGKIVGFFPKAVLNRTKSEQNGVPVHDNLTFVRIQNPGEKDFIEREANDVDKQRWPGQWQAFLQGRKFVADGTPLDQLFPSEPNIVATISQFNIQTVQQLANLSGDAISRGGIGFGNWVEKAKRYLATAKEGQAFHQIEAERRKWAEREAAMQKQINDLAAQVQQLVQAQSRMPSPQGYGLPQQGYDAQSHLIGNSMAERYPAPQPMQTVPERHIPQAPDLSQVIATSPTETTLPAKRRGRPAGSKNKPKETANG